MIESLTKKEPKQLNIGFLGVGWIGCNRMQVMMEHEKVKVISIVEPSEENASRALKIAGEAELKENAEDLFNDDSLDGIAIASPSAMHAKQCIGALKAGKAVFCQKPLGRTLPEVKEILETARENNKLLAVDFSYRFTKAFRAVYDVIKKGEIGDIYHVDLVFHNAYGPDKGWFYNYEKSGGGCVIDLGIHLVDMALLSLGFPNIKEISSKLYAGGKRLQPGEEKVEDFASVSMVSEKDTLINLECSWDLPAGTEAIIKARFYGSKGGVAFKNVNGSFYDFVAEKYEKTQTEKLVSPPDNWGGRAGIDWAADLALGKGFDSSGANELLRIAAIIDKIYGR